MTREALDALHRAGRIRSPWLRGMLVRKARAPGIQLRLTEATWAGPDDWELCLTDPATVGCLTALAREASGDPTLHAIGSRDMSGGIEWLVDSPNLRAGYIAAAEGDALATAIIAMAEALP